LGGLHHDTSSAVGLQGERGAKFLSLVDRGRSNYLAVVEFDRPGKGG